MGPPPSWYLRDHWIVVLRYTRSFFIFNYLQNTSLRIFKNSITRNKQELQVVITLGVNLIGLAKVGG